MDANFENDSATIRPDDIAEATWASLSPNSRRALMRLRSTREQLAVALNPPQRPRGGFFSGRRSTRGADTTHAPGATGSRPQAAFHAGDDAIGGMLSGLRERLDGLPAVGPALSVAEAWWQRQPFRPLVVDVLHRVEANVQDDVVPLIRRHPLAAISAGVAAGAAVIIARPWRWRSVRPLLRQHAMPMPRRIGDFLWQELKKAPTQAMLATLVSAMLAKSTTAGTASTSAARSERHTGAGTGPHEPYAPASAAAADARDRATVPT